MAPVDTNIEQGYTASLNCKAGGEPVPEVSWIWKRKVLSSKGRTRILPNNTLR